LVGLVVAGAVLLLLQVAGADLTALVPRSPLGLLVVAGTVAALVGWTALLRRVVAHRALRATAIGVPVVLLAAWLVVPLLSDRTVQEDLLAGVAVPAAAAGAVTAAPSAPASAAAGTPAPVPSAVPAPAAPAEPEVRSLGAGSLRGLDGHEATGTAELLEVAGTAFVRVADLDSTRSPDVRVWLVPAGQEDPSGGVELGALKGNRGTANYSVPAGTDLSRYGTVLLWCRAFSTPIGAADLALS
jgi:hypothetical protein